MRGADAYPLKTAAQGMEGILPFLGYLQAFQHENRQFYVVPKDVRAIYQELATASFLATQETRQPDPFLRHGGG